MTNPQKIATALAIAAVLYLIYLLTPVWQPFLIAALLAYLGDPLVNSLRHCKLSRTWAASLVFILIMSVVLLLFLFLVPLLGRQVSLLIDRLPQTILWAQQFVLPWLQQHFGISFSLDIPTLKAELAQHWRQAGSVAAVVWTTLSRSGLVLLEFLTNLILIPMVTFYLLRDWNNVVDGIRRLLPRHIEPVIVKLFSECDEVLGAFLRGQFFVMVGLAIVYSLGLAIVGLDLALLLGVLAGILAVVPYLGLIVGVLAASISAFMQFHDGIHVVYVLIVFGVGHLLESMVLTPWLVGDRIGLHPVAVIFAILAGGHLFGFVGILLALPAAAVIMVLLRHLKQDYLNSGLYR